MMYAAIYYVRLNGHLFTPGEIITGGTPEQMAGFLKKNAVTEIPEPDVKIIELKEKITENVVKNTEGVTEETTAPDVKKPAAKKKTAGKTTAKAVKKEDGK